MTGSGQGRQRGIVIALWSWGEQVAGSGRTEGTRMAAQGPCISQQLSGLGPQTPEFWVFMLWEVHQLFLSLSCIF